MLVDRLGRLLDDGTGVIHAELVPLFDTLRQMNVIRFPASRIRCEPVRGGLVNEYRRAS